MPAETKVKTKPETVQTLEVEDEIVTGKPLDEEATRVYGDSPSVNADAGDKDTLWLNLDIDSDLVPDVAPAKPEVAVVEADKLQVPAETKVKTKPETVQTVAVEDEIVTGKPLDEEATSV